MKWKTFKKEKKHIVPSIIAEGVKIKGAISSNGIIEVGGQIKGTIKCCAINVYSTGFISGDIIAEDISIKGQINGNITAKNIFLSETARVVGTISYQNIIISSGAIIDGKMCKINKEEVIYHRDDEIETEKQTMLTEQ